MLQNSTFSFTIFGSIVEKHFLRFSDFLKNNVISVKAAKVVVVVVVVGHIAKKFMICWVYLIVQQVINLIK
jgi:hypothetical protein